MNMLRLIFTSILFCSISISFSQSPTFANEIDNQLIVQFRSATDGQDWLGAARSSQSYSLQLNRVLSADLHIYLFDSRQVASDLQALLRDPHVLFVQKNGIAKDRGPLNPNDSLFNLQANLKLIKANEVWNTTTGGTTACGDEIVVAVNEVNCTEYAHPDLLPNVYLNLKEIPNDGLDNDNNGYIDDYYGINIGAKNGEVLCSDKNHGTKVSGIIGAAGNNSKGVTGVNWNVKLLIIKNNGIESNIIEAYDYVRTLRKKYNDSKGKEGAFIAATNFSAGISNERPDQHPIWCAIYDSLGVQGIISVGATDNASKDVEKTGDIPSLCNSSYLLIATNTDITDKLAGNAATGYLSVDLSAPGVSVFNLLGNNLYGSSLSGTSFATPAVTGAAALLMSIPSRRFCSFLQEQPATAALTIINAIRQGVDKIPDLKDVTVTGGRLNIFKALAELTTRFSDGIGELPSIKLIYPNPVVGADLFFYTNFEEGDAYTFTVLDATGRLISSESKLAATIIEKVDVSALAAGVYYVKIATPKGSDMAKIIKQ